METALGLIGFIAFIACVIGLAAGISWLVVKISPKPKTASPDPGATSSPSSS